MDDYKLLQELNSDQDSKVRQADSKMAAVDGVRAHPYIMHAKIRFVYHSSVPPRIFCGTFFNENVRIVFSTFFFTNYD